MRSVAVLLLILVLAGCSGPSGSPGPGDAAAAPGEGPVDDAGASPRDGGGDGASSSGTAGPGTAAAPTEETWYLHNVVSCTTEPCNCGSHRFFMDRTDSEGDCDGHGARPDPTREPDECRSACYPAEGPVGAFPAGSVVEGVVYLSTDAVDEVDVTVSLVDGEGPLGGGRVDGARVQGLGGVRYEAVGFRFVLDRGVSPDGVRFILGVEADVSYFVGYEDDHASFFRLTAPDP